MILSDNGTQMVGAEKELRKMIEGWNTENLREYFANRHGMEIHNPSGTTPEWMR